MQRPAIDKVIFFLSLGLIAAAAWAESCTDLPWQEAGLGEREAAAHLLSRLTFGARPGEIEKVLEVGLERWLERQLSGDLEDPRVAAYLDNLQAWELSSGEIAKRYPNPGQVLREAVRAGVGSREELGTLQDRGEGGPEKAALRAKVLTFARQEGYRRQAELRGELLGQKLFRGVHAENQLTEVLIDFWFNHFNVSLTDNESRVFIFAYERDAIRPHVLGSFPSMLEATAKHPAMLLYLDNARSVAAEGALTLPNASSRSGRRRGRGFSRATGERRRQQPGERRLKGLNENYARELLELHTLGVDGGYDQEDVIEVARAFTGWATLPPGAMGGRAEKELARYRRRPGLGFVFEEDFIFRADVHDAGPKRVLGRPLAAGRGIEDGLQVLDILVGHPATASHLARKLAIRFVADDPPASLVEHMATTFSRSRGHIATTLRCMLARPEFWSRETRGAKIKSPLELAVSALRALDTEIDDPFALLEWVRAMGQPLYAYQAPTGFPDRAEAWVNTGSLLNRMNFGLQLAAGRIPGLRFDLGALNGHREPESVDSALETYVEYLLPLGDHAETLERLRPLAHSEALAGRIEVSLLPASPVEQVVGVILGSPEFQRR